MEKEELLKLELKPGEYMVDNSRHYYWRKGKRLLRYGWTCRNKSGQLREGLAKTEEQAKIAACFLANRYS
jgi:hypothetical protein